MNGEILSHAVKKSSGIRMRGGLGGREVVGGMNTNGTLCCTIDLTLYSMSRASRPKRKIYFRVRVYGV